MNPTQTATPLQQTQFKKIKHVTVPQLKLEKNIEYAIRFVSEIVISDAATSSAPADTDAKTKMEPPMVAKVNYWDNPDHTFVYQIVCNTIMVKEMAKHYPNNAYVGKWFLISLRPIQGKKYIGVDITEIEVPAEAQAAQTPAKETPAKSK